MVVSPEGLGSRTCLPDAGETPRDTGCRAGGRSDGHWPERDITGRRGNVSSGPTAGARSGYRVITASGRRRRGSGYSVLRRQQEASARARDTHGQRDVETFRGAGPAVPPRAERTASVST